ncbi:hypothetical protein MMC13_001628, partial [Lambiella insularis]|nr:hypothetical protein [Lambiella insularis]
LLLQCRYEPSYRISCPPTNDNAAAQYLPRDLSSSGGQEVLGDVMVNTRLLDLAKISSWHESVSQGAQDSASSKFRLQNTITTRTLDVLTADGDSVPAVVANFFLIIDYWFPIIDSVRLQKELEAFSAEPSIELTLLLLCMQLVIQMPSQGPQRSTKLSPTYHYAKSLLSAFESYEQPSLRLVQASLLLALYEHGSGKVHASRHTMVVCASLGMEFVPQRWGTTNPRESSKEETHLWWGITVLDRLMNLGILSANVHMATGRLIDDRLDLYREMGKGSPERGGSIEAEASLGVVPHWPARTPNDYLLLTAQATQLLGRVLVCIKKWTGESPDSEEVYDLDQSLQALALILLQKASEKWESLCAPIALCFSALFTMHKAVYDIESQSVLREDDSIKHASVLAIKSAIRMVADIARSFNADKVSINTSALPLPATFCTFQAAMLLVEFSDDHFSGEPWRDDMHEIRTSLGVYSKRWSVG